MISISDMKEKVLTGGELTEAEAMSLANLNTDEYDKLLESAAEITDRFGSRNFDSCSIIKRPLRALSRRLQMVRPVGPP